MSAPRFATRLPVRALLFAALWWMLTGGAADAWWIGVPAVLAAAGISLWLVPRTLLRVSGFGLIRFLGFFAWHSLRGGIDVAWRALAPHRPLAPRLIVYRLRLPPGAARAFLADAISLLPGTLSAALERHQLRLHVLDHRRPVMTDVRAAEAHIAALFRIKLSALSGRRSANRRAER